MTLAQHHHDRSDAMADPAWTRSVHAFLNELETLGYSPLTRRDYGADLLRLGARQGLLPQDKDVQRALSEAARLDALEGLQAAALRRRAAAYHRFFRWLEQHEEQEGPVGGLLVERLDRVPVEDRVLVGLLYFAGLRLREIATLEGRDLRERAGVVRCRSGWRELPMHPRLAVWLDELRQELPRMPYRPILPGQRGFPASPRTLHARFARCVAAVGLDGAIKPDRLRREAAAHLRASGACAGLVQGFLGVDRGRAVAARKGMLLNLAALRHAIRTLPVGGGCHHADGRSGTDARRAEHEIDARRRAAG